MESSRIWRPKRRDLSVSALYGILSVVLLVATLLMALLVRPPPPPSVAALGPSPQEQIKDGRKNQAAGSGEAAATPSSAKATQSEIVNREDERSKTSKMQATSSEVRVPATRRCFGEPPRQTEDPHSPPCVFRIFEGENGGATAPGVTATEVRLVVSMFTVSESDKEYAEALLGHFNRRYEFYGRQLTIVKNESWSQNQNSTASPSESKALADSALAASPFAVISRYKEPFQLAYHRRLAEKHVHSILTPTPNFESGDVNDNFFWSTFPALDFRGNAVAEFICKSLTGRPARHAGDRDLMQKERKFAIVNQGDKDSGTWPNVDAIMHRLQQCGATVEEFKDNIGDPSRSRAIIGQLKAQGFTTIVQTGWQYNFNLTGAASQSMYFPEWVHMGLPLEEEERNWERPDSSEQSKHAFGIAPWVRVRRPSDIPACWALEEASRQCSSTGASIPVYIEELYKGMLVLAAGVQGSGPKLTEESFRRTLWDMTWPNPNPGEAPYWQQRVSFSPGKSHFYNDYTIWWWNENAATQQSNPVNADGRGSFCYLDRGGRFTLGSFPVSSDRRLFSTREPCR